MPGTPAEMNLTRAEARERARLLQVESYDVRLDLTTSETTFRSETAVRFGCDEPGAATFIDLAAEAVLEVELNGVRLDPATAVSGARIALPGLAADNTVRVVAECAVLAHRRGAAPVHRPRRRLGLPLHAARATRRDAGVQLLRPARPQGHASS